MILPQDAKESGMLTRRRRIKVREKNRFKAFFLSFVTAAVGVLAGIKEPIVVDAYINKISIETGIGKEAIYSEYKKRTHTNNKIRI